MTDFEVALTRDGSPTILVTNSQGQKEAMHHWQGAWSETLFVYAAAFQFLTPQPSEYRVFSLGMGLGYNEVLAACETLCRPNCPLTSLVSFESEPLFQESFSKFIENKTRGTPSALTKAFERIFQKASIHYGISVEHIKERLLHLRGNGVWVLEGAFDLQPKPGQSYNILLYDAFSKRLSPDLWQERLLTHFLKQSAACPSALASYAANGSLRRALSSSGFRLLARKGFAGKRQSTLAVLDEPPAADEDSVN